MSKHKTVLIASLPFILALCLLLFSCCSQSQANTAQDNITEDIYSQITFGKKYYYLGYDYYTTNEYYSFNKDGSASYTHIMKEGNNVTFQQEIIFKWTYSGKNEYTLLHNGTKIIKGKQDDAFGFCRVMHVAKDVIYWSASGENTYFICEDFVNQIPNYGKLIS